MARELPKFSLHCSHDPDLYGTGIFLAFAALPLFPRQKEDAQLRKRAWPSSDATGHLSVGLLGLTFTYSVTIIVLSMIPSMACLKIVGGEGCDGG